VENVKVVFTAYGRLSIAEDSPSPSYRQVPGWLVAQGSVERAQMQGAHNGSALVLPADPRWQTTPAGDRYVLLSPQGTLETVKVSAHAISEAYPKPAMFVVLQVADPAVQGFVSFQPAWLLPWADAKGAELFEFHEEPAMEADTRTWMAEGLRITFRKTRAGWAELLMQIGLQPSVLLREISWQQQAERLNHAGEGDFDVSGSTGYGSLDGIPRPAFAFRLAGSTRTYVVLLARAGICTGFSLAVSEPVPQLIDTPPFSLCAD
jgi:hypothetical protein